MTKAAGLEKSTSSYGAVRADFNADGWPDLFIGRHSNPGWLAYNDQDRRVRGRARRVHRTARPPRLCRGGCRW